ncbi:hypothetical protein AQJ64_07555 [Streptomyces griseoruber]|uniref:DUF397 domain-containing protein n=1 Tax=Streptomyces griseoruber TaxID=1943 RepID=A0A101T7J0_9ACTN|nr:hypothetical protein AQJ64_07555 [Streptomyces griseoruber]
MPFSVGAHAGSQGSLSTWRTSSYSGDQGGDGAEASAYSSTAVAVRDAKNPAGPILTLQPAVFSDFLSWAAAAATAAG